MNDAFSRALRFVEKGEDRCATAKQSVALGDALFNEDFPVVWDMNFIRLNHVADVTPRTVTNEADRIQGSRGLRHRKVVTTDRGVAEELVPALEEAGWLWERNLFMAHRRLPDRDSTHAVHEVVLEDLLDAKEQWTRSEPYAGDEDAVRQLVDCNFLVREVHNARYFAALREGIVTSYCELYSDGEVAQIEDVGTFGPYRRQGLAASVVLAALGAAAGHALTFLIADDRDWPKELYRKLGFDPVGFRWSMLKTPPGEGEP